MHSLAPGHGFLGTWLVIELQASSPCARINSLKQNYQPDFQVSTANCKQALAWDMPLSQYGGLEGCHIAQGMPQDRLVRDK